MKTQHKKVSQIVSEAATVPLLTVALPVELGDVANRALSFLRTLPQTIVIPGLLFVLTISATAGSIPASIQVTEAMMNTSGFDALSIVAGYGVDPSAVLQFSSYLNPETGAFSYSLLPDQTYLGKTLSLMTVGTYNSNTNTYSWTMTGKYEARALSGFGTQSWFGAPGPPIETDTVDQTDVLKGDGGTTKYRYQGTVYLDGNGSGGSSWFFGLTRTTNGKDPVKLDGKDSYTTSGGKNTYEWDSISFSDQASLREEGSVPFDGGIGSFSIRAVPTPEPASLLLLGSGILGLSSLLRKGLLRRT